MTYDTHIETFLTIIGRLVVINRFYPKQQIEFLEAKNAVTEDRLTSSESGLPCSYTLEATKIVTI